MIKIDEKRTTIAFLGTTRTLVNEMCNGLAELLRQIKKNTPELTTLSFATILEAMCKAGAEIRVDIAELTEIMSEEADEQALREFVDSLSEEETVALAKVIKDMAKEEGKHVKSRKEKR